MKPHGKGNRNGHHRDGARIGADDHSRRQNRPRGISERLRVGIGAGAIRRNAAKVRSESVLRRCASKLRRCIIQTRALMLQMQAVLRRLQFGTGMVLLTYLSMHLVNHALGLWSMELAGRGLEVALRLWRSA